MAGKVREYPFDEAAWRARARVEHRDGAGWNEMGVGGKIGAGQVVDVIGMAGPRGTSTSRLAADALWVQARAKASSFSVRMPRMPSMCWSVARASLVRSPSTTISPLDCSASARRQRKLASWPLVPGMMVAKGRRGGRSWFTGRLFETKPGGRPERLRI